LKGKAVHSRDRFAPEDMIYRLSRNVGKHHCVTYQKIEGINYTVKEAGSELLDP
jgi:hypothetical protein